MSLLSITGLDKLPPEIAAVLEPVLEHVITQAETQTKELVQASLTQVNGIIGAALDRINGAQVVVVCTCTIKLPEAGAKMAEVPPK